MTNHRLDWYKDNPPKDSYSIPSSLVGRVVTGRNIPSFNLTIKGDHDGVFLQDSDTKIRESEQKYNPKIIY